MNWRWTLALVGLLFLNLMLSVPASLVSLVLPADQLVMQGVSGTLWRGSSARTLIALNHGYLHLGRVEWRLSALSLLIFAPSAQVISRWGGQRISGTVTLHGSRDINLEEMDARVSASLIQQFAPIALGGHFELQNTQLSFLDGLPRTGTGRLLWRAGTWLSPQGPTALGSYAVDFARPRDQALRGEVVTLRGPLRAAGSIEIDERSYVIDISLTASGGLDPQLRQAVSLIAQPEGEGFRIALNGSL